jgi:adenylate cyclase
VALGGQEKEMTILFSDIRGFTTMSEGLQPKELIRIMNNYFSAMTEEILRHDGIIDKYIGDAIMAFWGAPLDDPNHATKALEAALAMVERLKKINLDFKAQGDPEINIGIGLYTGLAVVGNVGSNLKVNYTVLGDTVNTASRLEGQTKEYGVKIILGESTKNRAQGNYQFKSLGSTKVKGKEIPINIYTV